MREYSRLLKYLRPYQRKISAAMLCTVFVTAATLLIAPLAGLAFKAIGEKDLLLLNIGAAAIIGLYFLKGFLTYGQDYLSYFVSHRVIADLRQRLYDHLQILSLDFYGRWNTGELLSRMMNDIAALQATILTAFGVIIPQTILLAGLLAYIFWLNWRLSLLTLIALPLIIQAIRLFSAELRRFSESAQQKTADITSHVQETLSQIRVVKAFTMEKTESNKFKIKNDRTFEVTMKAEQMLATQNPVVAFLQAIFQHSLGLKFLGESVLRINFQGVAVVASAGLGEKFLRAYGTLPHPNILAAWLFLAIFSFYFWYLYEKQKRPVWVVLAVYPLLLFAFFFTFSRVMIGLWLLGLVLRLIFASVKRKKYRLSLIFRKRLFFLVAVTVVFVLIFSFLYWPQVKSRAGISSEELAISERIFYNEIAGKTALSKPLFGVGAGNFVWHMPNAFNLDKPYLYQPVHNIYLLIASENGLPGMVLFLLFLISLSHAFIKRTGLAMLHHLSLFIVLVSILAAGLFDHFLWSNQQGQIIFWITLALLAGLSSKSKINN